MKGLGNARASVVVIDDARAAQRVDNFLLRELKGVPRSRVYRLLRGGEVRVNSRRVEATYRLQPGDRVRIPPVRVSAAVQRSWHPPSTVREPGTPRASARLIADVLQGNVLL